MKGIVFSSRENVIDVKLVENGVPISSSDYDAILRMTLNFGHVLIDSEVTGHGFDKVFDWSSGEFLRLSLGKISDQLKKGTHRVEHVIYTRLSSNGIVWGYPIIIVM